MPMDERMRSGLAFAERMLGRGLKLEKLAGDASFRRYFRVSDGSRRWVLMDAPPEHEDVRPFLAVRVWMREAGLRVPELFGADIENGYLLLEDFGDLSWAEWMRRQEDPERLFPLATEQLGRLASARPKGLGVFDRARMRAECDLYLDWYLPRVAGLRPDDEARARFHRNLEPVYEALEALPRVPVHLDFHSRNLMVLDGGEGIELGILDFQDALWGPATYDAASLLYDCYQDYPETERRRWSRAMHEALPRPVSSAFDGFEDWHRKLRLTALQRHLKAIGIFARLAFRDGKRQFLDEIPLTRKHLAEELEALGGLAPNEPLLSL